MLKIFHVAPMRTDHASGVSIYVSSLIQELAKISDCHVGLLSVLQKDVFDVKKVVSGCTVLKGPATYHKNPWFIDSYWLDAVEKDFGRPDVVHFHGVYYPFACALARQCVKRGWKYVVSVHGGLQDASQKRKYWKKMIGNVLFFDVFLKEAIAVHVLNESEGSALRKKYPGINTFVVPNGVSADILTMGRMKPVSFEKILRIGFIGRIDIDHKGIDLLLKAVRLLQERHLDLSMTFVLVGHCHQLRDKKILDQLVFSLRDPKSIVLTGPLTGEDKWRMLSSFDCFVHTSRYEGMPGAVIEAMAFAKPCLVTPGTNMSEIITQCNGGWCCMATPESIMQALCDIAANRAEIVKRGNNAREYVRQYLTWDNIAVEYMRQIRVLLGAV